MMFDWRLRFQRVQSALLDFPKRWWAEYLAQSRFGALGQGAMTTLDLLKTFAVIVMVIDHIGFYLIPPGLGAAAGDPAYWWRVIGRWGLPIWFFLIGYAGTRRVPPVMYVGAILLLLANFVTGMFVFPLNALVSMILIRLTIDRLAGVAFAKPENLISGILLLALLFPPTNGLFEYGSIGFLMALMGRAVRAKSRHESLGVLSDPSAYRGFMGASVFCVVVSQAFLFDFGWTQLAAMTVGVVAIFMALIQNNQINFTFNHKYLPSTLKVFFQVCGRHTLEIYVGHLILFKFIALVFGVGFPIYGWFDWDWSIVDAFRHVSVPK